MTAPQIPGYDIVEKLREGGTATSWKAIQTSLKRTVNIKTLNSDGTPEDKAKLDSILTQLRKVASLKHSGFLELIDIGVSNGIYFIVTSASDGLTATEKLKRKPHLSEESILTIANDVAEALDYAWTKAGIYHGNIKPDNILINEDGGAMVSDIGMTRKERYQDPDTGESHDVTLGTPSYMSPEQVQCSRNIDFRTDIYSLGATLYTLATGIVPFSDTPGEEIMQCHLWGSLQNPKEINRDISSGLAVLIANMMVKNPSQRYGSWEAVLDDIERASTNRQLVPKADENAISTVRQAAARQPSPALAKPFTSRKKQVVAIPQPATAPAPSQEPQSRIRDLLGLIKWMFMLGAWSYLAYELLKLPPVE